MEGGATGGAVDRGAGAPGIAACAGTPASFCSGRGASGGADAGPEAGIPGMIGGRCANGAGCAPIVGRGADTLVDGRTKGAGIAPGPCVVRAGAAGMPSGDVGRTGAAGRTASCPAPGVPDTGAIGSVRAGTSGGACGAGERSAGLVVAEDTAGVGLAGTGAAGGGVTEAANGGVADTGADVIDGLAIDGVGARIVDGIAGAGVVGVALVPCGTAGDVRCDGLTAAAGDARGGVVLGGLVAGGTALAALAGVGVGIGAAGVAGVREPTGVADDTGVAPAFAGAANSSPPRSPASIVMTAPQTEQRARTLDAGIRAGSTRKTERHS